MLDIRIARWVSARFALTELNRSASIPVDVMRDRSKVRDLIATLRQEPGTTRIGTFKFLVEQACARQETLSKAPFDMITASLEPLRGADWRSDATLVEYLALGAELVRRTTGQHLYPSQLLAALLMLREIVVDMATGEGKTLVGILVSVGYVLQGRRVHVLTANDYLATRDADLAATIARTLDVSVSAVTASTSVASRKVKYGSRIVYTTVHQVGFDALYDRRATRLEDRRLSGRDVVLIDEIDAVLIDDAAVPLVLAGRGAQSTPIVSVHGLVRSLESGVDYSVDSESRNVALTDSGVACIERFLGVSNLFAAEQVDVLTAVNVALHAEVLLKRDVHYVISDGAVRIVSDVRGRVDERQRWPDGLHRAVEVKEGLARSEPAEVLDQSLVATVVSSYRTTTGMSGTALEAAERLAEDYGLKVAVVPPNRPLLRVDEPDALWATAVERDEAALERVCAAHSRRQPVLVGTQSVAESERFARYLKARGMNACLLNARNDREEAAIVARAGCAGAVTVSTQMAGRGVDIILDRTARAVGGLLMIGLGRNPSVRVDAQLRGRAGRQGDPGHTVFYTSLEDDLVLKSLEPSELAAVNAVRRDSITGLKHRRLYAHAQRVSEARLLQLHRKTSAYSSVLEQQRNLVLCERERYLSEDNALRTYFDRLTVASGSNLESVPLRSGVGTEILREIVLFHLDDEWKWYLAEVNDLRDGIHLRALGRQNPLVEFQLIAGDMFREFFDRVDHATASTLRMIATAGVDSELLRERLQRPGATWTYMVEENPFGTPEERFVQYLRSVVRGERRMVRKEVAK